MNSEMYEVGGMNRHRYELTIQQHRLLMCVVGMINRNDAATKWYLLPIKEYGKLCNVDVCRGGYYYNNLVDDAREMSMEYPQSPTWFSDVRKTAGEAAFSVRVNEFCLPYLAYLRRKYRSPRLNTVRRFKYMRSVMLYDLLLANGARRRLPQTIFFDLGILRENLNAQTYARWYDFDRYVLAKAVAEINNYSPDIHISYTTRKTGRSISAVVFTVEQPTPFAALTASRNRRQELDGY